MNYADFEERVNDCYAKIEKTLNTNSPKVGEFWYVKLPGVTALATELIKEITKHTVELSEDNYGSVRRYKISDIEFVEKSAKDSL